MSWVYVPGHDLLEEVVEGGVGVRHQQDPLVREGVVQVRDDLQTGRDNEETDMRVGVPVNLQAWGKIAAGIEVESCDPAGMTIRPARLVECRRREVLRAYVLKPPPTTYLHRDVGLAGPRRPHHHGQAWVHARADRLHLQDK